MSRLFVSLTDMHKKLALALLLSAFPLLLGLAPVSAAVEPCDPAVAQRVDEQAILRIDRRHHELNRYASAGVGEQLRIEVQRRGRLALQCAGTIVGQPPLQLGQRFAFRRACRARNSATPTKGSTESLV